MKHKWTYTPMYRPPSSVTLPAGWSLVERPAPGLGFDRRADLPISEYRFGIVAYEKPLSDGDEIRYQLKPVVPRCPSHGGYDCNHYA